MSVIAVKTLILDGHYLLDGAPPALVTGINLYSLSTETVLIYILHKPVQRQHYRFGYDLQVLMGHNRVFLTPEP